MSERRIKVVERKQKEIKPQADRVRNKETKKQADSGNKEASTKEKEDTMPVPAWKLSVSANAKVGPANQEEGQGSCFT